MFQVIQRVLRAASRFERLSQRDTNNLAVWLRCERLFKPKNSEIGLAHLLVQQSEVAIVSPGMLRAV